ncbi:MAG TPA: hypothetical protein VKV24_12420 [Casimicrobiaceae bacterium]|nr:hypothetical protein [Casimicrobiaceae bacterium]
MPLDNAVSIHRTSTRAKRLIALLVAIALAPVVLACLAYYVFPRDARVNYGELLQGTLPAIEGTRLDGASFDVDDLRGRWIVLYDAGATCTGRCADALYASRQARTIQNTERERVVRVLLVGGNATPASDLLAQHPDVVIVRVPDVPPLPRGADRIYLVDPLGNFVLAWPSKPDIKAMAKDLGRVLRASSVG